MAGDADEAAKERAETDPPPTDPDGSTPDGSAETPTTGTHDPLPRRQRRTPPESPSSKRGGELGSEPPKSDPG